MFSFLQKTLFSLSTISPLLLCGSLVWCYKEEYPEYAIGAALAAVAFFLVGGLLFVRFAKRCAESLPITEGEIASVSPGGQWLSVLFGSYLIPALGFLGEGLDPVAFVAALAVVAYMATWFSCTPPAAFLLILGYRFYDIAFSNGAGGFRLISKRRAILDPNDIKRVIFLFKGDVWLLEEADYHV